MTEDRRFTPINDPRTPRERLDEVLKAFCECEVHLELLDLEVGDGIYSQEAMETIQSVREGLAQALMHFVMSLHRAEAKI